MIHTAPASGVIVCQQATYLSGGKDGHRELQQALDLDLHGGQRALADRQRLGGGGIHNHPPTSDIHRKQ